MKTKLLILCLCLVLSTLSAETDRTITIDNQLIQSPSGNRTQATAHDSLTRHHLSDKRSNGEIADIGSPSAAKPTPSIQSDPKNAISDSLWAVNAISGALYYYFIGGYSYQEVDTQLGITFTGDVYDWGLMSYHYTGIAYLSFELPTIPEGYHLQSALLMVYAGEMVGNSEEGVYPTFDHDYGMVYPSGVLEHIDYGCSFEPDDLNPAQVYGAYTLFTPETLVPDSWQSYNVTNCMLMDYAKGRSLSQYRIYLDGFSDWDNQNDYIVLVTSSHSHNQHRVKIMYTLSDGSLVDDPTNTHPNLSVSCFPNPFSIESTVLVKSSEPSSCKLSIYNLKGQLIRSYSQSHNSPHTFQWDGRDYEGRKVSAGIYYAVAEAGRNKASSKLLYLH